MRYCFETRSTRSATAMSLESRESGVWSQRTILKEELNCATRNGSSEVSVLEDSRLWTSDSLDCPVMISAQTARGAVWRPLIELPGRYELVLSLARRELVARYKGSVLGIVWAVLTPVVMIAIFTFLFAGVFGARFGAS